MTQLPLEIVAAVAANGAIGRDGQLPWHLPDDLRHFKALTMGHPVIMGRRTYESVGRPLPGRLTIVISHSLANPPHQEVKLANSLEAAIALAAQATPGPAYVVGGAEIYRLALPRVSTMHLTELDEPVDGDTYFPMFDRCAWWIATETIHPPDDLHKIGFRIRKYIHV